MPISGPSGDQAQAGSQGTPETCSVIDSPPDTCWHRDQLPWWLLQKLPNMLSEHDSLPSLHGQIAEPVGSQQQRRFHGTIQPPFLLLGHQGAPLGERLRLLRSRPEPTQRCSTLTPCGGDNSLFPRKALLMGQVGATAGFVVHVGAVLRGTRPGRKGISPAPQHWAPWPRPGRALPG